VVDYKRFHPLTRQEWRDWLAANHDRSPGIWLVSYRQSTGKPRLTYDDMIEEALCFGWIDSRFKTLDAERSMLTMTPRKPRSAWAKTNKERVQRLIAGGLWRRPASRRSKRHRPMARGRPSMRSRSCGCQTIGASALRKSLP
jgi:uncharacterized protein YdeI (YjbR/CyaY-like superfamily)